MKIEPFKTHTKVHDAKEALNQKRDAETKGEGALCGFNIYLQLVLLLCYQLFSQIGTTSWQSVLVSLPAGLVLFYLGKLAARRGVPTFAPLLLIPALLMDMVLLMLAVCDLTSSFILPGSSRLVIALLTALFLELSLLSSGDAAYARLSRVLLLPVLLGLCWCLITSFGNLRLSNLTPVLGHGIKATLTASLLSVGAVWQAPLPLIMSSEREKKAPLSPLYLIFAVCLACLTALLIAGIWPMELLMRPLAPQKRMMLINQASDSTLSWSLLIVAWLLTLFLSLGACARSVQHIVKAVLPVKKISFIFSTLPFLLIIWPAQNGADRLIQFLYSLVPWRSALMGFVLVLSIIIGRREKPCEQAQS